MDEHQIMDILKETRIVWDATPQSVLGPTPATDVITSQEDFEASQRQIRELVGYGYFYVDVMNMDADLALMRSTRAGIWEADIIPQHLSPLLPEDLERCVEAAGGAMNWSGHYPLDEWSVDKVRASYLGRYQ